MWCLSLGHIREEEETPSASGASARLRTPVAPREAEQCPSPKCCSVQVRSERSLSRPHLIRNTSTHTSIHINYHAVGGETGMRQGTVGEQKAISIALRCLEKHRTAGYSSKGCSSWLWECYCDLRKDNIRATTKTRFKTLTVKVWQEKK